MSACPLCIDFTSKHGGGGGGDGGVYGTSDLVYGATSNRKCTGSIAPGTSGIHTYVVDGAKVQGLGRGGLSVFFGSSKRALMVCFFVVVCCLVLAYLLLGADPCCCSGAGAALLVLLSC